MNRFTINLFIEKDDNISKRNFSIRSESYNRELFELEISKRIDINDDKWIIESSEELEYIEKERVIFWKTKLKKSNEGNDSLSE